MTSLKSARSGCTKPVVVLLSGILFLVSVLLTMNVSTNIMNTSRVGDNEIMQRPGGSAHISIVKKTQQTLEQKSTPIGINGGNLRSSLVSQQDMISFKPETSCYIYRYSEHGVKKLKPNQTLGKLGCTRRQPKALIIGVKKCATGTLQRFLDLHPHLESVVNVIAVFPFNTNDIGHWMTQLELYLIMYTIISLSRLPENRRKPTYRYDEERAKNITLFQGYELFGSTFEETITDNRGNLNTSHAFIQYGIYIKAIQTLFHNFDRKRILVIDGEEFKQNPHFALKEVERFLGLSAFFKEEQFYFSSTKGFYCANVTDRPDTHCMSSSKDSGGKGTPHPSVDQNLLQQMTNFFTPYNSQLKDYLNRTLTFT
ncbi:heparan sulfate glucosamine 3-O-sulfotransferase 1-like [Amphiura filiformis]|uniref:heparan sulfate glucosamine 3-O-sulfotransferase 1-like n=1 Tax=Amphiura filiformis TaxID=82378 RepID=UPI003B218885